MYNCDKTFLNRWSWNQSTTCLVHHKTAQTTYPITRFDNDRYVSYQIKFRLPAIHQVAVQSKVPDDLRGAP